MAATTIALCVSALLVQGISGQCLNSRWIADNEYFNNNFGLNGAGLLENGLSLAEKSALGAGYDRLGGYYGWESGAPGFPGNGLSLADEAALGAYGGYNSAAALNGGGPFGVSSASYNAPNGVSAVADNLLYEGTVGVQGALPFLGTAGFGGEMLTSGAASIAYGAGDGRFGITGERAGSGANAAAASAAANGGLGFGAGLASQLGYGAGLSGAGLAGTGAGLATTALTNGLSYGAGLADYGLAGARANSCGRITGLAGGCACGL